MSADPLSDAEVADGSAKTLRANPRSAAMCSRWAGEPVHLEVPESLPPRGHTLPAFWLRPRGVTGAGGGRDGQG